MDENYRAIYKILKTLERAMDIEDFDYHCLNAKSLGISERRWTRILEMLIDEGYMKGISLARDAAGNTCSSVECPRITLRGLEYLSENSIMKRMFKAAKGIADIIPMA